MDKNEAGSTGITRRIARFASGLDWNALPPPVKARARAHLTDTLGAIIAGMRGDVASRVIALAAGSGVLPLPGSKAGETASSTAFAYICGTAAHGIELDDGYREGSVHPGVSVVPALLAASWNKPTDGRSFLTALVAGYEIVTGLAEAGHPALRRRGYHPTSATGPIGAAAAVSRFLGLDARQTETAIGLGASSCGGLFAFLSGGADVKRIHGGLAARGGLEAALLAEAGVESPDAVIEGPSGWAQAFTGQQADFPLPPDDRDFRILGCYLKPHACCRHLQPAFEATLDLVSANRLQPEEITAINVETYEISAHHAQVGWDSFANAQLSFPYLIALAVKHGDASLRRFDDEHRNAPWVSAVAEKLTVTATADLDRRYPRERPCRITLDTTRGRFSAEKAEASGGPEEPLSDDTIRTKFMELAAPILGGERAQALLHRAWTIEEAPDVSVLVDLASQA